MKKVVIIGLILIANLLSFFSFVDFKLKPFAIADEIKKYAQIQKENVQFFFASGGGLGFILPKSYYVELIANVDENGFYMARYLEQVGYVRKSDVQCVSSAPHRKFLDDVNFRILASQSAELRSEPSREKGANTLICELDLYETNFVFYGKQAGEEVVPKRGCDWYYCSYVKNGTEKFGYVYAGLIDQMKSYDELEMSAYPIDEHMWINANDEQVKQESLSLDMPDSSQFAVIVGISVPALLLLIALFRPVRLRKVIKNRATNNQGDLSSKRNERSNVISLPRQKKQARAEKGKDFYELK